LSGARIRRRHHVATTPPAAATTPPAAATTPPAAATSAVAVAVAWPVHPDVL
jgi:hypothetical protein